jgi:hypothetical protein
MKSAIRFSLIMFVVTILGGCSTLINPLKVIRMNEGYCEPPCWMGIMPQETSFGESLEIIEGLRFFLPGGWINADEDRGYINWYSGSSQNVYVRFENGYVSYIDAYVPDSTLGDVIKLFGQPSFYITYSHEEEPESGQVKFFEIDLFYPENGLVFTALWNEPLAEIIKLRDVYFINNGTPEQMIEEFQIHRRVIQPHYTVVEKEYFYWEGLGLCPQGLLSAEYCNE